MVAFIRRGMRLRLIVPALLLGMLLGISAAHADELQEAKALLQAHQYPQALARVDKLLAAKPDDARARFLKGLILTEKGDSKDAIAVYEKLTRDYPHLPEPYNNLAVIYARQGNYEKAREALEKSLRTHSSYATAYENLGDIYARLASRAYDKALHLDSAKAEGPSKLALVRSLDGFAPEATRVAVGNNESTRVAEGKISGPVTVAAAGPPAPPVVKPRVAPRPPKPAAAKVALAAPRPAPKHVDNPRKEILAAVEAWARAWSRQDVGAYLAHYAPDFETPGGTPREAWEELRRKRVSGPKSIEVTIRAPKVTLRSATSAQVSFHQSYRSNRFRAGSHKTLDMVKVGTRWLIRREEVGR